MALGFWITMLLSMWGESWTLITLIESYRQIPLGLSVCIASIITSLTLNRVLDESRAIPLETDESIMSTFDEVVFTVSQATKEFDENPYGMLVLTDKKVLFIKINDEEVTFALPLIKIIEVDNLYDVGSGSPLKTRKVHIVYFEDECVKKVTFQLKNKAASLTFVKDLKASIMPHPHGTVNAKKVAIRID